MQKVSEYGVFWSVFSRIRTGISLYSYWNFRKSKCLCSVRIQEWTRKTLYSKILKEVSKIYHSYEIQMKGQSIDLLINRKIGSFIISHIQKRGFGRAFLHWKLMNRKAVSCSIISRFIEFLLWTHSHCICIIQMTVKDK